MSSDREKLIELIRKSGCVQTWDYHTDDFADPNPILALADYLLANGVIVPPCKLGQRLYDIVEYVLGVVAPDIYELRADEMTVEKGVDGALNFVYNGIYINNEDIGKTVFLTKEEAEAKLKEREGK